MSIVSALTTSVIMSRPSALPPLFSPKILMNRPRGPSSASIRDFSAAIVIRPDPITVADTRGFPMMVPPWGDTASVHWRTRPLASRDLSSAGKPTAKLSVRPVVLATTTPSGSISCIDPRHGSPSVNCEIWATKVPTRNRSKRNDRRAGVIATLLTSGGALSEATVSRRLTPTVPLALVRVTSASTKICSLSPVSV